MNRILALIALASLLLLLGAGSASAVEITAKLPGEPLTVGETVKIPITVTGADQLTSLTLQIRSSSSAVLDTSGQPLGGMYTINPDNGKLVWLSTRAFSGDGDITYLIVTPGEAKDIPVEITLIGAIVQPSGTDDGTITDQVTVTNVTIPVKGSDTVAEVAPTKTRTPAPTTTSSGSSSSGSGSQGAKTTVPTAQKTTAAPSAAATTPVVTASSGTVGTTAVPTMTQASVPVAGMLLGLLAAAGVLIRRRE